METAAHRRLSDASWGALELALAAIRSPRGRPARCDRRFIEGVRWVLRTGAPWRDLPPCFGSWQTVYKRFSRWSKRGLWCALWNQLDTTIHGNKVRPAVLCLDSTSIRVHQHGAPRSREHAQQQVGRSRGGKTTKVHAACELVSGERFRVTRLLLSPGNLHDVVAAPQLLTEVERPGQEATKVVADKAYDAGWLRDRIRGAGQRPIIPSRSRRLPWSATDARAYRKRNIVERAFARLKHLRRVASRFERLAIHFGSFLQFAVAISLLSTAALPR